MVELEAHERANERYFQETETLLQFANRLTEIFANGGPDRRMAVLKVVASNATLGGRKARLNLRTAFAPLGKSRSFSNWLPIVNEVRTALIEDPLPLETVKGLLKVSVGADEEGEISREAPSPSRPL